MWLRHYKLFQFLRRRRRRQQLVFCLILLLCLRPPFYYYYYYAKDESFSQIIAVPDIGLGEISPVDDAGSLSLPLSTINSDDRKHNITTTGETPTENGDSTLPYSRAVEFVSATNSSNATSNVAADPTTVPLLRLPKSSPTALYWCGWEDWFSNAYSTSLALTLFPEVQHIAKFNASLRFAETDLLLHTCGPVCDGIDPSDIDQVFPGTIATFNGEPGSHRWWVRPSAKKRPRIVPLAAVDQPPGKQTAFRMPKDSVSLAQLVVARYPKEIQEKFFYNDDEGKRQRPRENTAGSRKNFLIYASRHCVEIRETAFVMLSSLGLVTHHANKQCRGLHSPLYHSLNAGRNIRLAHVSSAAINHGIEGQHKQVDNWQSNNVFYQDYRFALVMENTYKRGYITEKIVTAFVAGCIPIYYGTLQIFDIFNPNAFVYWNTTNPNSTLDQIRFLESNQTAFDKMSTEPILRNGTETIRQYFSLSDTIQGGELKWLLRKRMGFGPMRRGQQQQRMMQQMANQTAKN